MKAIYSFFIIVLMFFFVSCSESLDLIPEQSLNTEVALSTVDGMEIALNGAYNAMQAVEYYGREFVVMPEIEGNNVYLTIANSNRFLFNYQYLFLANNGDFTDFWNICYTTLLRLNNVINNIDALEGDAAVKSKLKGEALGLRALVHFDLVRFFGQPYTNGSPANDLGIPIVLEASIGEPARNTVAEVYDQIIADLIASQASAQDTESTRFSADAAEALLARVYLYKGDNAAAEAAATNIIPKYALATNVQQMWAGIGSSEEIFTLEYQSDETFGSDNLGQIYNPIGYGDIRVSADLIDLYEDSDQRKAFIYEHVDGEFYHSKYAEQDGIPGLVSPKILRVGEMYLIRAEARLKQNNSGGALEDINTLRTIRGASSLADLGSIDDIIKERRRELAFEGHTTFDYYRNNRSMVRTQCNTGIETRITECTISANDYRIIHPIPEREMLVNQNMDQNPGY